ncbi:MAG: hypothetical protein ACYDEH_07820 [Acidimicrobiales bacterium]
MALTKYLISFNDGAMDFSEEELAIVIEVASRDGAPRCAAKIATACHCAQEVRAFVPDPSR